jgi:small conductance mechanosensitive channel
MDLISLKIQLLAAVTQYGGKILLAIVVFVIGRVIISKFMNFVISRMNHGKIDRDVQPF